MFTVESARSSEMRHGAQIGASLGHSDIAFSSYLLPLTVPRDVEVHINKGETVAYLRRFDSAETDRRAARDGLPRNHVRMLRRMRRHGRFSTDDEAPPSPPEPTANRSDDEGRRGYRRQRQGVRPLRRLRRAWPQRRLRRSGSPLPLAPFPSFRRSD